MPALISHPADDYTGALQQLLPPGAALPREASAGLTQLLDGFAQELARVDARALDLIEELDPRTTLELVPDWERICGLPDACSGQIAATVPERRAAILAKLTVRGGQTPAYLAQLAASLGYFVVIDEYQPLRAGFHAGNRCQSTDWASTFSVQVLAPAAVPDGIYANFAGAELVFRTGSGRSGQHLASFGSSALACVVSRARPAHTTAIFAYPAPRSRRGPLILRRSNHAPHRHPRRRGRTVHRW